MKLEKLGEEGWGRRGEGERRRLGGKHDRSRRGVVGGVVLGDAGQEILIPARDEEERWIGGV